MKFFKIISILTWNHVFRDWNFNTIVAATPKCKPVTECAQSSLAGSPYCLCGTWRAYHTVFHTIAEVQVVQVLFYYGRPTCGHSILQLWFLSSYSFFFLLAYSQRPEIGRLPYMMWPIRPMPIRTNRTYGSYLRPVYVRVHFLPHVGYVRPVGTGVKKAAAYTART